MYLYVCVTCWLLYHTKEECGFSVYCIMKFGVLAMDCIRSTVYCDVTLCSLVDR
jgi:hypothetical protein